MTDYWPDLSLALRAALADDEVEGVTMSSDQITEVGATPFEVVIDRSDLTGSEQATAYAAVCDLVATRRVHGLAEVLGCIVFDDEPLAAPLASALAGTSFTHLTPVLPLSLDQATALVDSGADLESFVDDSIALISVAARQPVPSIGDAQGLLDQIDALVARRT